MKSVQLPTFAINGELRLDYVTSRQSGYGHKTITVEMIYKGHKKEFSKTTNNMHDYKKVRVSDHESEPQFRLFI